MKRSHPPLPAIAAIKNGQLVYATGQHQRLIVGPSAVLAMQKHRQLREGAPEAGGILFARISRDTINIEEATEPQPVDRRSRFSFWPCTSTQQRLINARFKEGLHFIGEWHTHPQPYPHPSGLDLESMKKCFRESQHELKALVMIIRGTDDSPNGLWVSIHNRRNYRRLEKIDV